MQNGAVRVRNVTFIARAGLYMGRPALAVMAQGKFVVLRFIQVKAGSTLSNEMKILAFKPLEDGFSYIPNRALVANEINNPEMKLDPLTPKQCGFDISRLSGKRVIIEIP